MHKKRLYLLFFIALISGYAWFIWSYNKYNAHSEFTPCVFKNVTGVPCPSCGSTRSVVLITEGNFTNAFLVNPMGYLAAFILLFFPLWLLYDIILRKDTLYKSYRRFESTLKIKWVAVIMVTAVIINWIWNICKGM